MSAALSAVDARRATSHALSTLASTLERERSIRVVAAGKAAVGMAAAVSTQLGSQISAGVMTTAASVEYPHWKLHPATHPKPSAASEAAGRDALALADAARTDGGLLLVCLSGGASAMLAVPAPGLTIADKAATTARMLAAGLDISEINTVRRHLSAVKGGQLAARAGRTVTLAISDVCTPVDDDPAVIGSGPTVGNTTTFADALDIVTRFGLRDTIPAVALAHLEAGARGDVPGPVPPDAPELRQSAYWVIASRHDAMRAAGEVASRLGYHVRTVKAPTIGEARLAPEALLDLAASLPRPACVIASGETTVRVTGSGMGGRNQEVAVAALERLHALGPAAFASVGTDGVDGPTDAGGAIVDSGMWTALGVDARADVQQALQDNNSYPLLERLGALIRSGPTGTNVGDLQIILLDS